MTGQAVDRFTRAALTLVMLGNASYAAGAPPRAVATGLAVTACVPMLAFGKEAASE